MNIKKRISELRIYRFVNRCKKDKLNYEVYYPRLYNIDRFPKLIRKINRLDPIEKEYVLSPLKSMKYGLNADEVYMTMKNQLDIVKKGHERVDLSKLYLSTVHISKSVYKELVDNYINDKLIGEYQAKDYIDMFMEKPFDFILNKSECSSISIDGLAPDKLRQALKHNQYGSKFLSVYHRLSQEEKQSLNDMNEKQFQKVLDFLFVNHDLEDDCNYNFQSRKKLLIGCGGISKKIDSLRLLPDYLIDYLSFDCNHTSKKNFYHHINFNSVNWLKELSATSEVQATNIKNLIKKGKIFSLPCENIQEIFKNVRKSGIKDETNTTRYRAKMKFLINDHDGFAFDIRNITLLKYTLNFICQNDSELVLNQKFSVLNALREELKNNQIDEQLYSEYLSFLNEGLERKTEKEKVRQIRARSKYFEDHTLSDFAEQLQDKPQQEKLKELFHQNQKPKRMVQNYRFALMTNDYQSEVVDMIINMLSEIEDVNYSKMLLSYIKSEQFRNLGIEKQKKHLTVLIDMLKEENKNINNVKSNSLEKKKQVA